MQVIAESLSEEEIAGLKEMFKMIDTDNSGQITFEELKAGLKRFGANLNESEIYDLMQAVSFYILNATKFKNFAYEHCPKRISRIILSRCVVKFDLIMLGIMIFCSGFWLFSDKCFIVIVIRATYYFCGA